MEEIWKDIEGWKNHYQISNLSRVRSLDFPMFHWRGGQSIEKGRIMKLKKDNGYLRIVLRKNGEQKNLAIHRLVAQAFIQNPENKPEINHINGIKTDNRIENLEWCTQKENCEHAFKIGLRKGLKGDKNPYSKLNEKQVRVIKYCIKLGMNCHAIAKYFPVNRSAISRIKNNHLWPHIKII